MSAGKPAHPTAPGPNDSRSRNPTLAPLGPGLPTRRAGPSDAAPSDRAVSCPSNGSGPSLSCSIFTRSHRRTVFASGSARRSRVAPAATSVFGPEVGISLTGVSALTSKTTSFFSAAQWKNRNRPPAPAQASVTLPGSGIAGLSLIASKSAGRMARGPAADAACFRAGLVGDGLVGPRLDRPRVRAARRGAVVVEGDLRLVVP